MNVATDLTLIVPDRVGALAGVFGLLGRAGISVLGHGGFPAWAGEGVLHLVVDDPVRATAALHGDGVEVREEREIVVVNVDDRPGALAAVLDRIAAAGVNVDLPYSLVDGRIAIGVNDRPRAVRALGG